MSQKATILGLLPTLSSAELGEVGRAIKALTGMSVLSSTIEKSDDFLLDGIAHYLTAVGAIGGLSGAVYFLKKRDAFKSYKEKRPYLDEFLQKLLRSLGTNGYRRQSQIAFLCASTLADMLKARGIFSVGTMLTQVDKIPEALDIAFPGYVESGLFGFILRSSDKVPL